jgi:hypothetical protein
MMPVATESIEATMLELAREAYSKGPGFAQESVVLREAQQRFLPQSLEEQQRILCAWHRLFEEGKLSWGYNLANPSPPFFHIPRYN